MKNKLQRLLAVPLVFLGMNVFMGHEAEAAATPAVSAALSASQLEQSIDPIMQEELEKRHIPGSAVVVTQETGLFSARVMVMPMLNRTSL